MFPRTSNLKTGTKRKKLQNERVKRRRRPSERHVLEVNPKSRIADRMKLKRGAFTGVKVLLCCAAALASVAGLKAGADRLFFSNPEFVVEGVQVKTDGVLTPSQIMEVAGISQGDNALKIDLEETRKKVEALPQVVTASIRREMPGGIGISLTEREAVAWLESDDLQIAAFRTRNGCLLSADGVAMPCHSLERNYLRLPVIHVEGLSRVKFGEVVDSKYVSSSLELIALNGKLLFEEQLEIRTIEVSNPYSLLAVFANDAEVTFGLEELEGQMRDFKTVIDNAEVQGWRIATLNLLVRENVPVTFFSGAPAGFDNGAGSVEFQESVEPADNQGTGRRNSDARAILGTLY